MAPSGGGGGGMASLFPLVAIFAIFYFLLIRPQQKKAKTHRMMLERLKKGDQVLTAGGLYGKITTLADNVITLEIADKVRVKVSRNQIAGIVPPSPLSPTSSSAKEDKEE
ncbi:MAG: preprotein translocase subunit YajC [Deltaproteobacteria bacterium]|nr:preprotein translocase subunit YajC [Deltaproteobacteria bacterium]MBW2306458.1 preprotein translocase subunit YajC [Deltaproteobacteria bacterium]